MFHNLKPAKTLDNVGKEEEKFRDYNVDESMAYVRETYRKMHTEQTVASGKEMVCRKFPRNFLHQVLSHLLILLSHVVCYLILLYIAVVLCIVIGQLHANKCDNHAMCR